MPRVGRRSTLSQAVAVERIDKMTAAIVEDVEIAILLRSALEAGNDVIHEIRGGKPALNFYGAHCYEAIRHGLIVSLALALAKLFDPTRLYDSRAKKKRRDKGPNDSDVISIPLLARLLKQRRCRSVPSRRARTWTPQLAGMEAYNEASALLGRGG
jgi:hypothetical protein